MFKLNIRGEHSLLFENTSDLHLPQCGLLIKDTYKCLHDWSKRFSLIDRSVDTYTLLLDCPLNSLLIENTSLLASVWISMHCSLKTPDWPEFVFTLTSLLDWSQSSKLIEDTCMPLFDWLQSGLFIDDIYASLLD